MDEETLLERLREEIRNIKATLDEAKTSGHTMNEAQTEFIIIEPLLRVLGYSPLEISKRNHDSVANNFPDYTLLWSKPQKWFLEAKKLDHALQDGEATQAVNYANNQGAEWAVLSNGRKWYIYNAHLPKPLVEKRVLQIDNVFADPDSAQILSLLSRQSMLNGGLTEAWKLQRVSALVKEQLATPNSSTRRMLRKIASDELKATVDEALIGRVLSSLTPGLPLAQPPATNAAIKPIESKTAPESPSSPSSSSESSMAAESALYTFEQLSNALLAAKRKPAFVYFGDVEPVKVNSWADAAKVVVSTEGNNRSLPQLPFSGDRKGKNHFLNGTPTHSNGNSMRNHREVKVGETSVFIDTNRSAPEISRNLTAFLRAIGAPIDSVKVSLREG